MDVDGSMRIMRVTWMLCAGIEDVKAVATLAMLVLAAYGEELLGRQLESEVRTSHAGGGAGCVLGLWDCRRQVK